MVGLTDEYLQNLQEKLPNNVTESIDYLNFEAALRWQSKSQGSIGQLFDSAIESNAFIAGKKLLLYAGETNGVSVIEEWANPQSSGLPAEVYTAAQTPMNNALDSFYNKVTSDVRSGTLFSRLNEADVNLILDAINATNNSFISRQVVIQKHSPDVFVAVGTDLIDGNRVRPGSDLIASELPNLLPTDTLNGRQVGNTSVADRLAAAELTGQDLIRGIDSAGALPSTESVKLTAADLTKAGAFLREGEFSQSSVIDYLRGRVALGSLPSLDNVSPDKIIDVGRAIAAGTIPETSAGNMLIGEIVTGSTPSGTQSSAADLAKVGESVRSGSGTTGDYALNGVGGLMFFADTAAVWGNYQREGGFGPDTQAALGRAELMWGPAVVVGAQSWALGGSFFAGAAAGGLLGLVLSRVDVQLDAWKADNGDFGGHSQEAAAETAALGAGWALAGGPGLLAVGAYIIINKGMQKYPDTATSIFYAAADPAGMDMSWITGRRFDGTPVDSAAQQLSNSQALAGIDTSGVSACQVRLDQSGQISGLDLGYNGGTQVSRFFGGAIGSAIFDSSGHLRAAVTGLVDGSTSVFPDFDSLTFKTNGSGQITGVDIRTKSAVIDRTIGTSGANTGAPIEDSVKLGNGTTFTSTLGDTPAFDGTGRWTNTIDFGNAAPGFAGLSLTYEGDALDIGRLANATQTTTPSTANGYNINTLSWADSDGRTLAAIDKVTDTGLPAGSAADAMIRVTRSQGDGTLDFTDFKFDGATQATGVAANGRVLTDGSTVLITTDGETIFVPPSEATASGAGSTNQASLAGMDADAIGFLKQFRYEDFAAAQQQQAQATTSGWDATVTSTPVITGAQIGDVFGSTLGNVLANQVIGGSQLARISSGTVLSAVLRTVGSSAGGMLDGFAGGADFSTAFDGAVRNFGRSIGPSLAQAGVGAVSSWLTSELMDSLGVGHSFGGQLVRTAANSLVSQAMPSMLAANDNGTWSCVDRAAPAQCSVSRGQAA